MWQNILSAVEKVNGAINDFVWGIPMIVMILGTGLLLTIRTRFLQVRKFGESLSTTIARSERARKKPGTQKPSPSLRHFPPPFPVPSEPETSSVCPPPF